MPSSTVVQIATSEVLKSGRIGIVVMMGVVDIVEMVVVVEVD